MYLYYVGGFGSQISCDRTVIKVEEELHVHCQRKVNVARLQSVVRLLVGIMPKKQGEELHDRCM
jgi:hypothetical protein